LMAKGYPTIRGWIQLSFYVGITSLGALILSFYLGLSSQQRNNVIQRIQIVLSFRKD